MKKPPVSLAELAGSPAVVNAFQKRMDRHFFADSCEAESECCYCELHSLIAKAVDLLEDLDLPALRDGAYRQRH